MKIFFNEKPKRKGYSAIMGVATVIMLFYLVYILGHNPFLDFKSLIFASLLIIMGLTSTTLAQVVENISFFDSSDKLKRYIISESVKCLLLLVCMVIIYIFFQVARP